MPNHKLDLVLCIILSTIVLIGTVGNVISIYTWTRGERCRKSTFAAFFVILSTLDTFLLILPGIELVLALSPVPFNFPVVSDYTCKASFYIFQLLAQVSMWLIVCLTVSRTIFIYKPWLQMSRKKIYIMTGALTLIFAGLNIPYLLYDEVEHKHVAERFKGDYIPFNEDVKFYQNGTVRMHRKCVPSFPGHFDALSYTVILQAGIFVAIPFIINFVCNCLMILQLFRRMSNARDLGNAQLSRAHRDIRTFTKRVIIISITHCVATIPQVAFDIYMKTQDLRDKPFSHGVDHLFLDRLVSFLFYINSFVNLFLYYTTGSDFKKDLMALLRCK